jgi:dipeptidase E
LNAEASYLADLLRYSKRTPRPIVARPGDRMIVISGKIECIGDPLWLSNGAVDHVREMALAEISSSRNSG